LTTTIAVNHPLIYKGYSIYQASFSDGGSILSLEAWPLDPAVGKDIVEFEAKVFERRNMHWGEQSMQLEITAFRPFNINPDPTEDEPGNLRNFGPSFGFKLRSETGEAKEYLNYMLPVPRNGRDFYLSGVRSSQADEFAYLYLPLDEDNGLDGFNQYLTLLHDDVTVSRIAEQMMLDTLADVANVDNNLEQSLQITLEKLMAMFVNGGFMEVGRFIETSLPEGERETLGSAYLSMLREMLARVYYHQQGLLAASDISDRQLMFLQDMIDAIGSLPRYGAPVFFELADYEHIEASGLQVSHSPGKSTVYLGCAFLIIGVFLLFYLPQRRLWLMVKPKGTGSNILFAGMSNRNPREFELFFAQISQTLQDTKSG